ncbi:MAG: N-acetylmuramoyl-L-alanine amidase [Verrucomicrobiota bacterium]
MSRRKYKTRNSLLFFALLLTGSELLAEDWNVRQAQGREYVTFANVAQFYQFPDYTRVSRTVSLRGEHRTIRAQAGTSEVSINGVRFFTNFPLVGSGNDDLISVMDVSKIIEPVLRPSRIRNGGKVETVVLDPGHGGTDQGASSSWGSEKTFALDVALAARTQLLRAGYKVEMTRSDDTGRSREERVDFANRFPNAVFVSIHFNSAAGGIGVESYSLAPAGVPSNASSEHHVSAAEMGGEEGNAQDGQNIALTAAVHAAVLSRLVAFDRGIRHARFHVLRDVKIPAVLIECGFITHPVEGPRIATLSYRQQLGVSIAQGIRTYDAAVNYRAGSGTLAAAKRSLPAHTRSITEALGPDYSGEAVAPHPPSVSINPGE